MFRSPLLGFKKFWLNHPDWQYLYILYSVYQKCFFFSCILYYAHSIMYSWQTFLWQINKKLWTTSDTHHILWFSKSLTQTHTCMQVLKCTWVLYLPEKRNDEMGVLCIVNHKLFGFLQHNLPETLKHGHTWGKKNPNNCYFIFYDIFLTILCWCFLVQMERNF